MKILILDAHSNAALAIVQSLGRAGYELYLAGASSDVISWHSKYPRQHFIYPDPLMDKDLFKNWMLDIQTQIQFDKIIPVTDNTIYPLMELTADTILVNSFILPDKKSFEWAFNKEKSLELASRLKIPVPESARIKSSSWAPQDFKKFPYFVKPVHSKAWREGTGKILEPKIVKTKDELMTCVEEFLDFGHVLIQERVPGKGVGIEVLCRHGEIVQSFAHQRIHEYPLTGGGSSYRMSIPLPPHLMEAAQKLLKEIHWHGVAMVEFKTHQDNFWLMEINGRFWGSLPLAIFAGVDFPKSLIELIFQDKLPLQTNYRKKVYARHLKVDIQWFKANLRADKKNPYLLTRGVFISLLELLRIFTGKECWDHASFKDPKPILKEISKIFTTEWAAFTSKLKMKAVLKDAKKDSFKAINKQSPRRILILCYGNICRSPFVERYLQKLFQNRLIQVKSSGFYNIPARPSPTAFIHIAKEAGIDLSDHRSSVIDHRLANWADIIVIMDGKNWNLLIEFDKKLPAKTVWLGAFLDKKDIEIDDPYSKNESQMREIIADLIEASQSLAKQIG